MDLLTLARGALADSHAGPRRHWLVHFPDAEPREVIFTPAVTLAEALSACPGAVAATPMPDRDNARLATAAERAELMGLVATVYATPTDRAEALAAALADVDAALICYRTLV